MPQLDTLRALAVFAVMVHHWLPGLGHFEPWGDLGVRCFFVLSGFLITGALLRARAAVESGASTPAWQMRQFYIRRSLRIFPIYYLTLLVGALLGMQALRDTFWWHASYASNLYFALRGQWQGYISHLWSLSVEEQFYLLWPAVVLFLPRRSLPLFFLACIGLAVATRAGLTAAFGPSHITLKVLLPCCLDALVMGALLAWLSSPQSTWSTNCRRLLRDAVAPATLLFLGVCALGHSGVATRTVAVAGPLIESAFFAVVIGRCAQGVGGPAGKFLDLPVLQYFGRISYGLYLYHLFAAYVASMFAHKLGFTVPGPGLAQFGLFFAMTVAGAAASHQLIEKPVCRLKRFFPAEAGKPAATRTAATGVPLRNLAETLP
jgi:peptidoglycan/LPS O-acetylase OafA/YrhL